jgi:hypothetical protein
MSAAPSPGSNFEIVRAMERLQGLPVLLHIPK